MVSKISRDSEPVPSAPIELDEITIRGTRANDFAILLSSFPRFICKPEATFYIFRYRSVNYISFNQLQLFIIYNQLHAPFRSVCRFRAVARQNILLYSFLRAVSIFTSCPPISLFVLRTLCSPMHPTPVCILFRVLTDKSGSARGDTLYSRRRGPLRRGPQIPDRGITIGGSLAAIHGGPLTSRGGTSAFRCRFLR